MSRFPSGREGSPGQLLRPAQSLCYAQQRGDFEIALHAGRQALTLNPELKDNSAFMQRLSKLEPDSGSGHATTSRPNAFVFPTEASDELHAPRGNPGSERNERTTNAEILAFRRDIRKTHSNGGTSKGA